MAELGRTVRVNDLPTEIEDDRLKDKLYIHFLRVRNGGGEIDSVVIDKTMPGSALIVFEDSAVAQRVIQRSRHSLEVDERNYNITTIEYSENLDPDKIILNVSASVNYICLPGGAEALTNLCKSHSEVRIRYRESERCCILSGSYSKMQAALAELLGHTEGGKSAVNKDTNQAFLKDSGSSQSIPKQKPDGQSRKASKQKDKSHSGRPSKDIDSSRNLSTAGFEFEDNTNDAVAQSHSTSEEDLSLILDADMFQYLKKCCQKEYRNILSQYGVEVIDETNQGLATLFLRNAETAPREDGREQERLKLARKAISQLYQENEEIRRDKLPKAILFPREGLQRAVENLCVKYPKLLLNEDEQNIYIIGSSSDVSEAKCALLLNHSEVRDSSDDGAGLGRHSLFNLDSSLSQGDKEEVPLRTPSAAQSLDDRNYFQKLEEESKVEKARRCKLAARFIDSGLNPLANRPIDFTLRTNSASSRQTRVGPMLGHDVLSERAGISGETIPRAAPQNTGEDLLFKGVSTVPSSASAQTSTSVNADTLDAPPAGLTSASSLNVPRFSGGTPLPSPGSESNLKRANSFSGTPQQKAQIAGQKTQDDSSKPSVRARGRSSSFSSQTGRNKEQEVYQAEISAIAVMWGHIKEAYKTRIDELTSDIQLHENSGKTSREVTLSIKGADSSVVGSCQRGIQKLIDSVEVDFSIHELRLSDLGNTDMNDETLQACCSEVKSRFNKVTLKVFKNSLYFFGPKQLCSQVCATMQEIFCGVSEVHDLSEPSTSLLQANERQSPSPPPSSTSKMLPKSQTSKGSGTSGKQEWNTTYRSDFCEMQVVNGSNSQSSTWLDPVFKEKVKIADKMELKETKVKPTASQSGNTKTSPNPVNGGEKERPIGATPTDSTPEETRVGEVNQTSICVCGKKGMSLRRTKCGGSFCPECMKTVHANCRVCHEMEQTRQGIQGEMKCSRLNIAVPGHNKAYAIKITYRIPDGIQGVDHPSPGQPFRGRIFEAFLPECEMAEKLLPRLEKAFRLGLTFTVMGTGAEAGVTWDAIPHKTTLFGGKAQKGYPDSSYLTRLSEVLTAHGI